MASLYRPDTSHLTQALPNPAGRRDPNQRMNQLANTYLLGRGIGKQLKKDFPNAETKANLKIAKVYAQNGKATPEQIKLIREYDPEWMEGLVVSKEMEAEDRRNREQRDLEADQQAARDLHKTKNIADYTDEDIALSERAYPGLANTMAAIRFNRAREVAAANEDQRKTLQAIYDAENAAAARIIGTSASVMAGHAETPEQRAQIWEAMTKDLKEQAPDKHAELMTIAKHILHTDASGNLVIEERDVQQLMEFADTIYTDDAFEDSSYATDKATSQLLRVGNMTGGLELFEQGRLTVEQDLEGGSVVPAMGGIPVGEADRILGGGAAPTAPGIQLDPGLLKTTQNLRGGTPETSKLIDTGKVGGKPTTQATAGSEAPGGDNQPAKEAPSLEQRIRTSLDKRFKGKDKESIKKFIDRRIDTLLKNKDLDTKAAVSLRRRLYQDYVD